MSGSRPSLLIEGEGQNKTSAVDIVDGDPPAAQPSTAAAAASSASAAVDVSLEDGATPERQQPTAALNGDPIVTNITSATSFDALIAALKPLSAGMAVRRRAGGWH